MSSHKNMSDRPTLERVKSVPCPSPPDPIHSELIDELDQIRHLRKARDSRAAELLSMSNRSAIEKTRPSHVLLVTHNRERSANFIPDSRAQSRIGSDAWPLKIC
jgi:hypothetical protein